MNHIFLPVVVRRFVHTLALAALLIRASASPGGKQEIGVLINVIDHDYEQITRAQFEKLSAIGFHTVELGAYLKPLSRDLQNRYAAAQFRTLAHGGSLHELTSSLAEVIADAHARGQPYIVCYWPWLDGAQHVTVDQCKESGRLLNELGTRCKKAGLIFAFHNHALEFQPLAGRTVMDWLLEFSDPGLVQIEFDVYHALHGKCDVNKFMREHAGRIPILHLNTLDELSENPVAGDGMDDFPGILRTSREIGARYLVIEGSGLKHPFRYLEESYQRVLTLTQLTARSN